MQQLWFNMQTKYSKFDTGFSLVSCKCPNAVKALSLFNLISLFILLSHVIANFYAHSYLTTVCLIYSSNLCLYTECSYFFFLTNQGFSCYLCILCQQLDKITGLPSDSTRSDCWVQESFQLHLWGQIFSYFGKLKTGNYFQVWCIDAVCVCLQSW